MEKQIPIQLIRQIDKLERLTDTMDGWMERQIPIQLIRQTDQLERPTDMIDRFFFWFRCRSDDHILDINCTRFKTTFESAPNWMCKEIFISLFFCFNTIVMSTISAPDQ